VSSTNRASTRRAVCRCFFGASRSERNMSSIAALNGASRVEVRAGLFRGGGIALANACRTVRRCT
jgi:hypothetical protein